MEHVEFTYTARMDGETAEQRLRDAETGILSLADGGDAYGIPLVHHYEGGDSVIVRLGVHEGSEKIEQVEATDRTCYAVFGFESDDRSWSVLVRGPIRQVTAGDERLAVAEINRQYPEIRISDEDVADLEVRRFELRAEATTGRKTVEE